jgi:hypothetical protein
MAQPRFMPTMELVVTAKDAFCVYEVKSNEEDTTVILLCKQDTLAVVEEVLIDIRVMQMKEAMKRGSTILTLL